MTAIFLDVHLSRLPEWLQMRGICQTNRKWEEQVNDLKSRFEQTLKALPPDDNARWQVKRMEEMCYFDYERIVSEFESSVKNNHQDDNEAVGRLKEWTKMLGQYKKHNAHIAEAADILLKGVHLALPALKKQYQQTKLKLKGTEKLLVTTEKEQTQASNQLNSLLTQLDITGSEELDDLAHKMKKDLSKACSLIAESARAVVPALFYYRRFVAFAHKRFIEDEAIKALEILITKGDIPLCDYKRTLPASISTAKSAIARAKSTGSFDLRGSVAAGQASGDRNDSSIDWGDDFVIDDMHVVTMLEDKATRDLILQGLCQLRCFLRQRLLSNKDSYDLVTEVVTRENSEIFPPSEEADRMFEYVHSLYKSLTDRGFVRLCAFNDYPGKLTSQRDTIIRKEEEWKSLSVQKASLTTQANTLSLRSVALKEEIGSLVTRLRHIYDRLCRAIEEASPRQIQIAIAGCGDLMKT